MTAVWFLAGREGQQNRPNIADPQDFVLSNLIREFANH